MKFDLLTKSNLPTAKLAAPTKAADPGEITLCWLVSNLNRSPGDENYSKKVATGGKKLGRWPHWLP